LYFSWLGHYTTCLVLPALAGFGCWVEVIISDRADVQSVPFFGLFMCGWCTFFLETWKRKQAGLALLWGMAGFEAAEETGTVGR
jgi:hypothetical protein